MNNVPFNTCVDECPDGYVTNKIDYTCDKCGGDEYLDDDDNTCSKCTDFGLSCDKCNSEGCLWCSGKFVVNTLGFCSFDDDVTPCNSDEARDPTTNLDTCTSCPSECKSCHYESVGMVCDECYSNKFYDPKIKKCLNSINSLTQKVIYNGYNAGTVVDQDDFPTDIYYAFLNCGSLKYDSYLNIVCDDCF